MILTDYLVVLALVLGLLAWWNRRLLTRSGWIIGSAVVVVATGMWSILDDRWQAGIAILPAILMLLGLALGHKRPRKGIPWISGPFFTLLAVLACLGIYFFPIKDLPLPTGEYPVGVRDFELTDTSRPGLIAAGPQEPRRLLVRVWYPAGSTDGFHRRAYFSDQEVDTTAISIGRFLSAPFAFKYLKHVKTNSHEGAPLAVMAEQMPAVVYSHGYTSFASQNTALMEELASHGYAVYSIQHTFDSAPSVFPNGDVLDSDPSLMDDLKAVAQPSEAMLRGFTGATYADRRGGQIDAHEEALASNDRIAARSTRIWTEDRIFVLDQLQAGAVPETVKDLASASNFEHTGQIGMSFGGSTTGEVCMVDKRCGAGVNLDGGDFHFTPFGRNEPVPFLMLYSDYNKIAAMLTGDPNAVGHGFNDFSYERPETAGLRADVVRLKVNSVTHLGVSDFTWFVRTPLRNAMFGSIDSLDMIQIQNDFVLGFFDTYLRHKSVDFPQAQFARHKTWVEQQDLSGLRAYWLETHQEDQTVRVILETTLGDIEVALYPQRAPKAVAEFLAYVDGGKYNGASFYGTSGLAEDGSIKQVRAGLGSQQSDPMLNDPIAADSALPPIADEHAKETDLPSESGTLAAVLSTESAGVGPEFVFNLEDNPEFDSGNTTSSLDVPRYATFGRVLRGLPLLRSIGAMPASASRSVAVGGVQVLDQPVTIRRAYRVE